MSDLIDKDTAVEVAARRCRIAHEKWEEYGDYGDFCEAAAFRRVAIELDKLPSAEPESRPRGRWEEGRRVGYGWSSVWFRYCSECLHERSDDNTDNDTPYCPWCGAQMENGGENETD